MTVSAAPKISSNLDTNFLKLVALLSMTVDHVGAVLFPDLQILRILGRIAFPLFAYCLVVGVLYTHDIKKYLLRLTAFALISQPFYVLASHGYSMADFLENVTVLNIFFTLILGVCAVYGLQSKKYWLTAAAVVVVCLFNFDYGINGIMLMVLFYLLRNKPKASLIVVTLFLLNGFWGGSDLTPWGLSLNRQGFAVLSVPLIYCKTSVHPKINKYIFYAYYPAHLFVLYLIRLLAG